MKEDLLYFLLRQLLTGNFVMLHQEIAYTRLPGVYSAVGNVSDSRARGARLEIRSSYLLSFPLPLIQEGQLSVTGKVCAL